MPSRVCQKPVGFESTVYGSGHRPKHGALASEPPVRATHGVTEDPLTQFESGVHVTAVEDDHHLGPTFFVSVLPPVLLRAPR